VISIVSVSRSIQEGNKRIASHRGLFVSLILILAWIPIPIGSNRSWSVALFEVGAVSIFGIWTLRYAYRPFIIPNTVKELRLALTILGIWLCFPLIQLIPAPTWLGQVISGAPQGLYSQLPGLPVSGALYLSLDRSATLAGFLLQCALVAVFFGVVSMADSRKRLRALLVLFFVVGCAESLYGLIVYLGGGQIGLWDPGHDAGTVSGTYVNQNHFGGLMEMTIPAGMGLLLMGRTSQETGRGLRSALRSIVSTMMGQQGIVLFGLLVMFAALILSTSRGAVGSLAVGVIVAVSIAIMRKGARARELRVGLIAAVLMVFAMLWLGTGQLSSKLEFSGLASNRGDLREMSYRMIADSPVVGTGVGTYRWIFPRYKDQRFGSGFYEHAHNDYLEILGEQGIVGFSLLAIAFTMIAAKIVKAYRRHNEPLVRGALFAAIAGCTALLVHGFVDFNFQIPANAAYFSALLGVGAVAAGIGRDSNP